MFQWDSTGVDVQTLLPVGKWFPFKITNAEEAMSKNNDPMIKLEVTVFDYPKYNGIKIPHTIVFPDPRVTWAGINVHFRKCIGMPWEGNVKVDHRDWITCKFLGRIKHEEYNGNTYSRIDQVSPYKDVTSGQIATVNETKPIEDEFHEASVLEG